MFLRGMRSEINLSVKSPELIHQDEPRRIHAQLAAEQNCEEGMGWPTRMPEDLEVESMPAEEDEPT